MLIELPFEIGDDLWWVSEETMEVCCEKAGIHGVAIYKDRICIIDQCGEQARLHTDCACLTREEAEAIRDGLLKE